MVYTIYTRLRERTKQSPNKGEKFMKTLKQILEGLNENDRVRVFDNSLIDDTTAGAFLADELNENELELPVCEIDDRRKILGYVYIKVQVNG